MADLIDRKILRLMKVEECAGHSIDYAKGWKTCIDWIKTLPSISQWIPWWQEYPDNNRFVLVCNDDGRMAIAQYIGHEEDAYHPWQIAYCPYDVDVWDDDEHGKIMAWMDLPKPYREK